jgi:AcrR family transcriptional regulator
VPVASRTRVARAERAQATRRRIVEAAGPLFVEHGYLETTMAGIARAADVAVQTLYLSFGSKVAVLDGALSAAGEDHPAEWLAKLRDESDGRAALAAYVTATAAVVERKHPLATVLRAAAADPEPAELLERWRHAALANHAEAVDELAEKPGFTHQLSLQRATDIVAALLSPEAYALLVVDHGWTTPDWCDWTARHLAADLFP